MPRNTTVDPMKRRTVLSKMRANLRLKTTKILQEVNFKKAQRGMAVATSLFMHPAGKGNLVHLRGGWGDGAGLGGRQGLFFAVLY